MERGGTRRRTRRRMNRRANAAADDQAQAAPQAPAQAPAEDDNLAQLEKLGELRDKGVITQEEFDAKKQQLLGL